MLAGAKPAMKSLILLGINSGFGNTDAPSLPSPSIDQERRRIEFRRLKTGVERRVSLWEGTAAALRTALEIRPNRASPDVADLAFLTAHRRGWAIVAPDDERSDQLCSSSESC